MQEKEERSYKKIALVEHAMEDKESGVMDCLLEALKTGTAFSREGKKKRNARLAGGAVLLNVYYYCDNYIIISAERRAQLTRTRSRLATRSYCDVM